MLAPSAEGINLPIDKLGRIEEALDAAQMYGSSLHHQVSLFGLSSAGVKDFAGLRELVQEYVVEHANRDVSDRIWFLIAIRQKLNEGVGRDAAAHLKLLSNYKPIWHHTARDMMETGSYEDLRTVATSLAAEFPEA